MNISLAVSFCVMLAPSCAAMPLQANNGEDIWRVRPPVSLAQALAAADKALGKDAARFYCVDAVAVPIRYIRPGVGNTPIQAPIKPGQIEWFLNYAATDGQTKKIDVAPNGKATIEEKQDDTYVRGFLVNVSPVIAKPAPISRDTHSHRKRRTKN